MYPTSVENILSYRFVYVSYYDIFLQAEDGIRDRNVTGVQTCALPISLLENLQVGRRTRPDAVLGDKAYSSRANRSLLRSRKIEAVISEPSDQKGHRLRRGS